MIKAVLLDLDNTLLGNEPNTFTWHYLKLLESYLVTTLGFEGAAQAIMECVGIMVQDRNPADTNHEVFFAQLTPRLPVSLAEFEVAVETFYAEQYPTLNVHTSARPNTRPLVDWLIAQDYAVVVATNPLFPRVAIEQRLAWAGTPVDEVPFALVTTLENMHFTKPHPHYYEEILARVGVQADEALMVGDDWSNDIEPARQAGLNTFWITNDPAQVGESAPPDGAGSLEQFACMVQEENWLDTLHPREHTREQIAPRLLGNLAGLFGMVREAPRKVWHQYPDTAEWSPIEVVCHLVESEREVQLPRLKMIAEQDNPFLSQPKEPPAPASRVCPEDVWLVAHAFAQARHATLDFLDGLTPEQWTRPARHYIFGPTTLLEVAHFMAQHDRLHLTQLCQTVGRCGQ